MEGITNGRYISTTISRGTGDLHEDIEFLPNLKTLTRRKPVIWKRPHVRIIIIKH